MATNILLLGADGQVGWELRRSLLSVGTVTAVTRRDCELADKAAVTGLVNTTRPDIIVNAAAYTAVDLAESEATLAWSLNRDLPELLGQLARARNALVVDYSTDYVFDGSKPVFDGAKPVFDGAKPAFDGSKAGRYLESDATSPVNTYGASKLAGLQALQSSACRHLVFRVSWVYSARRSNFVRTILRLAAERNELKVVSDQIGSPTPASLIADVTANVLSLLANGVGKEGVYHLAPQGQTSWHDLAQYIVRSAAAAGIALGLKPEDIKATPTSGYPTPAKRPANSLLDTTKLQRTFKLSLPDWQEPLEHLLQDISAAASSDAPSAVGANSGSESTPGTKSTPGTSNS